MQFSEELLSCFWSVLQGRSSFVTNDGIHVVRVKDSKNTQMQEMMIKYNSEQAGKSVAHLYIRKISNDGVPMDMWR